MAMSKQSSLSIGTVFVVILGVLIYVKLGRYGGPIRVPDEAVPIWANSDLSLGNKILEYIFPLIIPLGTMIKCPTMPPYDAECMEPVRRAISVAAKDPWNSVIYPYYEETTIQIEQEDALPLDVILLRPRNMTTSTSDAPFIFWIHSGGFVAGEARDAYLASVVKELLNSTSNSSMVRNAIWASVEYRLAPEYPYPAALDDCSRSFQYLTTEYTVDGRYLGGGGVHIGGVSAGATLGLSLAIRELRTGSKIDSLLIDEPGLVLPRKNVKHATSPLDSYSHRRNAFSRLVPTVWMDWAVAAYVGMPLEDVSKRSDLDFTGGTMSVSEWKTSAGDRPLPPVVLMTTKGDPLHDGGLEFGKVYREAGGIVYHMEASTSHAVVFNFDPSAAKLMVTSWARLLEEVIPRDN